MHFRCKFSFALLTCALLASTQVAQASTWTSLHTKDSTYLGELLPINSQRQVLTLHSLPYAKPPVGLNRFRLPQPLDQKPEMIDARALPPACMQMPHSLSATSSLLRLDAEHRVSEDCLYLSVYVPIRLEDAHSNNSSRLTTEQLLSRNRRLLPTLVWFAGEGFDFADARQFDGSALAAASDAIVVSVQYRVGVFGFLRADGLTDGNQGLWDQVQALQFLQTHLQHFGGDAHAVTVMGRFTGAMSLSILLTSPYLASRRLFDRAILTSGVAAGDWVFDRHPTHRLNALLEGLQCSINGSNTTAISECVQNASAEQLLAVGGFGWKPVYDGRLVVGQPIALLEAGLFAVNVSDVLIGSNEHDGSLCYQIQKAMNTVAALQLENGDLTRDAYLQLVQQSLAMFFENEEQSFRLLQLIAAQPTTVDNDHTERYIRFCSQLLMSTHQERFAQMLQSRTSLISYRLLSQPSHSSTPNALRGAGFGDDVLLAFGQWQQGRDSQMAEHFRRFIGAFIHHGSAGVQHMQKKSNDSPLHLRLTVPGVISELETPIAPVPETVSQSLDTLRNQLSNAPTMNGFSCQLPSDSQSRPPIPGQNLLVRLFQRAIERNTTHVVCAHSGSKANFMSILRQSHTLGAIPIRAS